MQQQLIGSINSANGLQKIRFTQDVMASHLFVRATALQVGAVATTEADWGNFRIENKDGQVVNCSGALLRALANVLKGNPIFTPGAGAGTAIEFYLPIFRRLPGERNVDFFRKDDNYVFEWEPGSGLAAKVDASFVMELSALPALGNKLYDLHILRQTRPVNASQVDTISVDEENIAMLFLSDALTLPETMASGNLRNGRVGVRIGPMGSYGTVQSHIASTQAFMRLEGAADFEVMACIFDASIISEGFGGDLFDGAKVEILNGSGGASTVAIVSVSKRMRRSAKAASREIVNQEIGKIVAQARRDGHSSKLAVLEDAGLIR